MMRFPPRKLEFVFATNEDARAAKNAIMQSIDPGRIVKKIQLKRTLPLWKGDGTLRYSLFATFIGLMDGEDAARICRQYNGVPRRRLIP